MGEKKRVNVKIVVNESIEIKLKELAKKNNSSFLNTVQLILREYLKRPENFDISNNSKFYNPDEERAVFFLKVDQALVDSLFETAIKECRTLSNTIAYVITTYVNSFLRE